MPSTRPSPAPWISCPPSSGRRSPGAVEVLLADPSLGELAGSVIGFFSEPGVAAALAGAAGQFATAVLTGGDIGDALTAAWGSLQADPAIQAVVDLAVTDLVGGLLDDATASQLLGDTVTQLVTGLVDDAALGELAGSVLTGFIGSPGVPAALAEVAGEFATALLSGADLGGAAFGAWNLCRPARRSKPRWRRRSPASPAVCSTTPRPCNTSPERFPDCSTDFSATPP